MTMKIEGSTRGNALTGVNNPLPPRGKENPASAQKQDSVSLSSASAQLQALETSVQQAAGFDSAKVDSIRQAISEGRYRASPERIADGMLASARELVGQSRP
jgi:negative regulator of flagellin synthesis FlgM